MELYATHVVITEAGSAIARIEILKVGYADHLRRRIECFDKLCDEAESLHKAVMAHVPVNKTANKALLEKAADLRLALEEATGRKVPVFAEATSAKK